MERSLTSPKTPTYVRRFGQAFLDTLLTSTVVLTDIAFPTDPSGFQHNTTPVLYPKEMPVLFLSILLLAALLSATDPTPPPLEPISGDNVADLRVINTLDYGDARFFRGNTFTRTEEGEYRLYDPFSGELVRTFTPGPEELWVDGFVDVLPERVVGVERMRRYVTQPPQDSVYGNATLFSVGPGAERLVVYTSTLFVPDPAERGALVVVIAPDGTVLNRVEHDQMVQLAIWSPDGAHFATVSRYVDSYHPGQDPTVFTRDGEPVATLDHGFAPDEQIDTVWHTYWLDETRLLTTTSLGWAYVWDALTGERLTTFAPGDSRALRFHADDAGFILHNSELVRVLSADGELLHEFPDDGYGSLSFVNGGEALLAWSRDGRPFRVLARDGTLLSESSVPVLNRSDDVYIEPVQAFNDDRSLLLTFHGDDCSAETNALYLWSLEDPAEPLAVLPFEGYVRAVGLLPGAVWAIVGRQNVMWPRCDDREPGDHQLVFWTFDGQRAKVIDFPQGTRLNWWREQNAFFLRYDDYEELWGVPAGG